MKHILGTFIIALPKEFMLPAFQFDSLYDFTIKATVSYSAAPEGIEIIAVDHVTWCGIKYVDWNNPELEKYFLGAAKNNLSSLIGEEVQNNREFFDDQPKVEFVEPIDFNIGHPYGGII